MLELVSNGGIKDLPPSSINGVMVWVLDFNKQTVNVHDVHGKKNLLVLTTSTEDGCLLPMESSGIHDRDDTVCLPLDSGDAYVELVLGNKVQGLPGFCSMSPVAEEGKLVEESLQVVVFAEGKDVVASK